MAIIKNPQDPIEVTNIKILLYGSPGIRKTSFAFTANNCLLLDCDRGVRRVSPQYRKQYIEVNSWEEISTLPMDPDVKKFDTLIIDTAGKLMDFMAAWLMKGNPKFNFNGAPTLQCYGAMKNHFRNWLSLLEMTNKNLIFIAHDREGKDGEQTIIRPDITGASMMILLREMDMVGYMESKNNRSTLCFNPTDRYYGKNSCGIAPIDDLTGRNVQQIFDLYHKQQDSINEVAGNYQALLDIITIKIETVTDATTAAVVAEEMKSLESIWDSTLQARIWFANKLKTLNIQYNKESKSYEPIPAIITLPAVISQETTGTQVVG